ncbi:hypothetical protein ACFFX1_17750 [Dactylosporangium sucinum]|nr:hypothetical protein [Dactylosporangium sucinum]
MRRTLTGVALAALLIAPAAAAPAQHRRAVAENQETEGPREPPVRGFAADRRIIVYSTTS